MPHEDSARMAAKAHRPQFLYNLPDKLWYIHESEIFLHFDVEAALDFPSQRIYLFCVYPLSTTDCQGIIDDLGSY